MTPSVLRVRDTDGNWITIPAIGTGSGDISGLIYEGDNPPDSALIWIADSTEEPVQAMSWGHWGEGGVLYDG